MQAYELSLAGVRIPQDVKLTTIGMPHDNVINVVLSGQADEGLTYRCFGEYGQQIGHEADQGA